MGEGIKYSKHVHIECGGHGVTEYPGGIIVCDTCGADLSEKDVLTEYDLIIEPWLYLWFWFKRNFLGKGGKK